MKVGFYIAFGWWIAAGLSDMLDFAVRTGYILIMTAMAQVS